MIFNYRENYSAHDAAILATQVYVEREWEEAIEIFDAGANEIEIVGSLEIPWIELQLAGDGNYIKNYERTDNLFAEDMVVVNFCIGIESVTFGTRRGFNDTMERVLDEYFLLLKKDIMEKFLSFKEAIEENSVEYYSELSVCNAAAIALMPHYDVQQLPLVVYLFGKIQDKICFDCIRMHNYYGRCLE